MFSEIDYDINLRFLERFPTQASGDWLSVKRLTVGLISVNYSGHTDPAILHERLTGSPRGIVGEQAESTPRPPGLTRPCYGP